MDLEDWKVAGVLGVWVVLMLIAAVHDSRVRMEYRNNFYAECAKDHKGYECDTLYRQATVRR